MCDCRYEDDIPANPNCAIHNNRPSPGVNYGTSSRKRRPMEKGTSCSGAQSVSTYNDETSNEDNYHSRHRSYNSSSTPLNIDSGSLQHIQRLMDVTGTQGIAVVQCQKTDTKTPLGYAGAVRRQNPNTRSDKSRKLRAALPAIGRLPCCPKTASSRTQPSGCWQAND